MMLFFYFSSTRIYITKKSENFKIFLRDDRMTIDYTYLWDLVCIPNPNLFEAGINLIILEIPENDITNNIELVCPTNHYSVHTFDARKRSLILIKRENYFEPIYGYRNDGKTIHITKTFSEYDKKLPKTLRAVFSKIIKPTLGEKCKAFPSMKEYRFTQAPVLDKLIDELDHKRYTVSYQVLNFQGKVIGVMARNRKGLEGFIPCYPSALTNMINKKCYNKLKKKTEDVGSSEKTVSSSVKTPELSMSSKETNKQPRLNIEELIKKYNLDDDSLSSMDDEDIQLYLDDKEAFYNKYGIKHKGGSNGNNCEYDFVYMNDDIWKPYEQTLEFLKEY
jgi:hypothetical protein